MSNLSDLLNPAPDSGPASPKLSSDAPNLPSHYPTENGDAARKVAGTTYDAASALTALAHSSAPVNGPWTQHSPTTSYATYPPSASADQYSSRRYSDGRPGSSYSATAVPVEPSPPVDRSEQPISPTLDQYHHGSKSPEQPRRQSLQTRNSPPPRLPPIQGLTSTLNEQGKQEQKAHEQDAPKIIASGSFPANIGDREQYLDGFATSSTPSHMANESTTDQIQRSSPLPEDTKPAPLRPVSSAAEPTSATSPAIHIKPEPSATPREITPAQAPGLDEETLKAVEALKNEHGLRGSGVRKQSSPSIPPIPVISTVPAMTAETKSTATVGKKRSAPRSTTKKGTASTVKKPPAKKRKVNVLTDASSPTTTPLTTQGPHRSSATPSSRTSKTPAIRGGTSNNNTHSSPAPGPPHAHPAHSSPPASRPGSSAAISASATGSSAAASDNEHSHSHDDEDAASTDDNERYCICRRPDNHTWMIACDGGCDDWFHGACVAIAEADGELIDTYICPNCERGGKGRTTWKAMCRREGCRRPARVGRGVRGAGGGGGGKRGGRGGNAGVGGERSKYCSEECGLRFFREKLGLEEREGQKGGRRGRRKSNFTDNTLVTGEVEDAGEDLGSRGGALRVGEVAALVDAVPDFASFRALGEGVLSPPATVVEPDERGKDLTEGTIAFQTESEKGKLAHIVKRKEELRAKHSLFKEREKFIALCKEQHGKVAEREGVDPKNLCGYDFRLSWTDEEFRAWLERQKQKEVPKKEDGDAPMVNGDSNAGKESGTEGEGEVCMRKKCPRHSNWKQLVLQDVRFEVADVGDEMRRVDKEEKEIRERAMVRWREKVNGSGDSAHVELVEDGDIDAKIEAKVNEDAVINETAAAKEIATVLETGHTIASGDVEMQNAAEAA
ncbi:MAG: hypothetical protein Q9165_002745 [Trypethelium subeluteriae]